MKDVIIVSYEGAVLVKEIPNNIKRTDVFDIARIQLQRKKGQALAGLCNVRYVANPIMLDNDEDRWSDKCFYGHEIHVTCDYEEVK